jgi:hypothetical protein
MRSLLLALLLLLAVGCQSAHVVIDGVQPTMSADAIAKVVTTQLEANEKLAGTRIATIQILEMTATTGDRIHAFEPQAGDTGPAMTGTVWVVRARGTFFNPAGVDPASMVVGSGYFVVADADGQIVGSGTP